MVGIYYEDFDDKKEDDKKGREKGVGKQMMDTKSKETHHINRK